MTATVDLIKTIVEGIPTMSGSSHTDSLYFIHGTYKDVTQQLMDKMQSPTYKDNLFPLVILFQPFREEIRNNGYERTARLNLVICDQTDPKYTAAERYDNTFPTLYNIYDSLLEAFKRSETVHAYRPDHDKTDHPYWGNQGLYGYEGNLFNNYLDALEIESLEVMVFQSC